MGISAIVGTIIDTVASAGAAVAGAGSAIAGGVAGLAEGIGIPAAIAGPLGGGVELGLGEGALGAATDPSNPLKGFESGAISGFVGGAGGPLIGDLIPGISPALATTAANAIGGAAGNAATGGNVATGAITGAASGLAASALPGLGGSGGGVSATGSAAPAGVTLDPAAAGNLGDPSLSGQITGAPINSSLPGNVGAGASAGGGAGSLPGNVVSAGAPSATGIDTSVSSLAPPITAPASGLNVPPATTLAAQAPTTGIDTSVGALSPSISAPSAGSGLSGFLGALNRNPGLATAGVGLLGDVIKGNQMAPEQQALEASAKRLGLQGQLDENYLRSGQLPPAQQAILNAQGEAAKAAINSQYASRGTPGSSANVEDIANEGFRQFGVGAQMAEQLFQSGVQETGMSNQVLAELLNVQLQQDNDLSGAIAKMSTSLANMGQPIQPGAS